MRTIFYPDPTGETAVGNVLKEEKRLARMKEIIERKIRQKDFDRLKEKQQKERPPDEMP